MWKQISNFLMGKPASRETAKGRLQLVLAHDRTGLDGARLQEMRQELAEVIARYIEIDPESVEIEIESADRENSRLNVSSPLGGARARAG
jgi:cell division topological specificity factor